MSKSYSPPYTITPKVVSLVAEISEAIGQFSALEAAAKELLLRRVNRIRTIQGSLAIEGNTLSMEQIAAILEGKRVVAPPREIQEVRNAIIAYDRFLDWQPWMEKDLLDCHAILLSGLLDAPGRETLILSRWNQLFANIPVESLVHERDPKKDLLIRLIMNMLAQGEKE